MYLNAYLNEMTFRLNLATVRHKKGTYIPS